MNCPKCRHDHTRVTDTKDSGRRVRRYRVCRKCGHSFPTLEELVLKVEPEAAEPAAAAPAPTAGAVAGPEPAEPAPADRKPPRFQPSAIHIPAGVCVEAARLLLEWWNGSRLSKHGRKAAWTEEAFRGSADRVSALPDRQQVELAQAGVEAGWMALKVEYLGSKPRQLAADEFAPTDPQLVEAMSGPF